MVGRIGLVGRIVRAAFLADPPEAGEGRDVFVRRRACCVVRSRNCAVFIFSETMKARPPVGKFCRIQ